MAGGGVMKVLMAIAVLLALIAYCLYTPIPKGYSATSARRLQILLTGIKLIDYTAFAGSLVGLGSYVGIHRQISEFMIRHMVVHVDPDVKETDWVFDGVPVRVYEPQNRLSNVTLPGIIYYHGGGFTFGNLEIVADIARRLCKETNAVVISVNYRLAPENIFPAAFDDCVTATMFLLKNADTYGVDPHRVAVAGDSAGGNLAAVVSLKLRDISFKPSIKMQVLIYPGVQGLDFQLPSMLQNADGPILTRYMMTFFTAMYLDGNGDNIRMFLDNNHVAPHFKKSGMAFFDVSGLPRKYLVGYKKPSTDFGDEEVWNKMKNKLLNKYYSPLMAPQLDGLPMAYVFTAEHDPIRDEGLLYMYRLKQAGVNVTHVHSDIGIHGIMSLINNFPEANKVFIQMTQFINDSL
jgi:acetyl esterase/lipase